MAPQDRRSAIVAAAGPLLRRGGAGVTTRQIAQAAGIAEGTIFRVFPTKQDVIDAVVADALDMSGTLDRLRAVDRDAPLEGKVRACAGILRDRLTSVIELMIALRMTGPPSAPDADGARPPGGAVPDPHRHRHSEVLDAVAGLLEPDAGRLACTPRRAAHLLRLLTFAGAHRMINDQEFLTADEITELLLHGIVRDAPPESGLPPPDSQR
jgi:AcrR family transcriptional regulator